MSALVGEKVSVSTTTTKDTYYGTLESVDEAAVTLVDAYWGWHGEAGWWGHGSCERVVLPLCNVRVIASVVSPSSPGQESQVATNASQVGSSPSQEDS